MKFSDLICELESLSAEGLFTRGKIAWWLMKYEEMYLELSRTKDTLEVEFPGRNLRLHKEFIKELLFIELYESLEISFEKTDSDMISGEPSYRPKVKVGTDTEYMDLWVAAQYAGIKYDSKEYDRLFRSKN